MDWEAIRKSLPTLETWGLINIMVRLKLCVNKTLALEIAKRDDAVFWLRKLIQNGHNWHVIEPEDGWAPIHAMFILPLIRTRDALTLLLDVVRYRGHDLDDYLTEDVPDLLVAFGEDAVDPLIEFTKDETLEPFARGTGITALGVLAKKFPTRMNAVKEHMLKLLDATEDNVFATCIVDDLATFHDPAVIPDIRRAFEEGKIDKFFIGMDDVESIINNKEDIAHPGPVRDPLYHFSRKKIELVHSRCRPRDEKDRTVMDRIPSSPTSQHSIYQKSQTKPETKKVGKNDPCPCGSGKKYKKCCRFKDLSRRGRIQ